MKRWISLALILALSLSLMAGCKKAEEEESAAADSYVAGQMQSGGQQNEEGGSSEQEENKGGSSAGSGSANGSGSASDKPSGGGSSDQGGQSDKDQSSGGSNTNGGNSSSDPAGNDKDPSEEKEEQETPPAKGEEALANSLKVGTNNMALNLKGQKVMKKGNCISAPVEVEYGDRLTIGPISPAQVIVGFCYDSKGKAVELINATSMKAEATFPGGWRIYTYSVPQKGATVQWSISSEMKDYTVAARNNAFSLKDHEKLSGVKNDYFGDCLYEKRGLFVGDSICVGSGGWAQRLAVSTGMEAVNNGISGTSLSTARPNWIVDQILKSKSEDFDYVLIHGGVNDAWESAEVGFMADGFDPDEFDLNTYAGGLEWNIYNAVKYYGDTAAIGYLMNFKMPAAKPGRCRDMSEYFSVAKEICEKWGITYFDMYNHKEITEKLALTTTKHTYDEKNMVHISASGYDIITPYIEEYMRTMTACSQSLLKEIL